ncbi:MAG: flagellar basal body L-ring protein FlgH [Betaproteobacteria bacterium]|jgi:flagellar L-ring protein FlgH|nr:flagellar basal body L-ring protein FlgH [Betaproteobacteria bacterium]MBU6512133.1 flagellar basal body L-ring protein FlgH [Betaproteobacteria bacterium]MDE1954645.1 flagellar basal body L-ring protein FlgH [Betaproteobacteria bacterium]MDE2152420.1 flagellar basal body L-ring protein FlgH [Betaproteobacteria bacterium]MDE2479677.1 flagellar basal body L-ring protein FlgH [Betaproteobacteria bacterium]
MNTPAPLLRRACAPLLAAAALLLAGCAASPSDKMALQPLEPLPIPAQPQAMNAHPANGAIWQDGTNVALFEDSRAHRVGDLITILIAENANASKSTNTTIAKSDTVSAGLSSLFGVQPSLGAYTPSLGATSAQKFGGNGATTQSNTFTTTLQATIVQVMSNGNLELSGQKEVLLNGGHEFIRVVGVVRAADVTPQNTVTSTQIADARVEYSGNGSVYDAAKVPWLTKFFLSLWPF